MYWSHFGMQESTKLVEKCNFKILKKQFIRESLSDDPECGHLFILAQKIPAK